MAADQREEGREEGAALRSRAFVDHLGELVELDEQEHEAEQAGDEQPALCPSMFLRFAAIIARPQTKLETSSAIVSTATSGAVEQLAA